MIYTKTPKGNLCLQAEPKDDEMLRELFEQHGHCDTNFLSELLERTGWGPNGHFTMVRPEVVGALTDSPIISDDLRLQAPEEAQSSDESVGQANIWWFPEYETISLPERLLRKGCVTLTLSN